MNTMHPTTAARLSILASMTGVKSASTETGEAPTMPTAKKPPEAKTQAEELAALDQRFQDIVQGKPTKLAALEKFISEAEELRKTAGISDVVASVGKNVSAHTPRVSRAIGAYWPHALGAGALAGGLTYANLRATKGTKAQERLADSAISRYRMLNPPKIRAFAVGSPEEFDQLIAQNADNAELNAIPVLIQAKQLNDSKAGHKAPKREGAVVGALPAGESVDWAGKVAAIKAAAPYGGIMSLDNFSRGALTPEQQAAYDSGLLNRLASNQVDFGHLKGYERDQLLKMDPSLKAQFDEASKAYAGQVPTPALKNPLTGKDMIQAGSMDISGSPEALAAARAAVNQKFQAGAHAALGKNINQAIDSKTEWAPEFLKDKLHELGNSEWGQRLLTSPEGSALGVLNPLNMSGGQVIGGLGALGLGLATDHPWLGALGGAAAMFGPQLWNAYQHGGFGGGNAAAPASGNWNANTGGTDGGWTPNANSSVESIVGNQPQGQQPAANPTNAMGTDYGGAVTAPKAPGGPGWSTAGT